MTKKIRIADLPEFDIAEHLDSEQAMAEYLTVVLEENDPAALAGALGSIARARGMSEIAKARRVLRERRCTEHYALMRSRDSIRSAASAQRWA